MRILGIETSCDESAVCLIEADGGFGPVFRFSVLGNALYSQAALHAQYGGVFPNLAKREHAKNLVPLATDVLTQAGMLHPADGHHLHADGAHLHHLHELLSREPELLRQVLPFLGQHAKPDIDAIAVTRGPGLEPALWVGINFAKALAKAWDLPLIAVNHMEGHIILSMMDLRNPTSGTLRAFEFPLLALLISGGHTELVLSDKFASYRLVGATRDDAAGEAFDKVARLLELDYPGGPEIGRLAAEARAGNTEPEFEFTRPMLHDANFDFSFSGLKTAVRRRVEARQCRGDALTIEFRREIARGFEDAVADVLVGKTMRAVEEFGVSTVIVGGGVSANAFIRQRLADALAAAGSPAALLVPPLSLATDNALMIALAGYFRAIHREFAEPDALKAAGNLSIAAV